MFRIFLLITVCIADPISLSTTLTCYLGPELLCSGMGTDWTTTASGVALYPDVITPITNDTEFRHVVTTSQLVCGLAADLVCWFIRRFRGLEPISYAQPHTVVPLVAAVASSDNTICWVDINGMVSCHNATHTYPIPLLIVEPVISFSLDIRGSICYTTTIDVACWSDGSLQIYYEPDASAAALDPYRNLIYQSNDNNIRSANITLHHGARMVTSPDRRGRCFRTSHDLVCDGHPVAVVSATATSVAVLGDRICSLTPETLKCSGGNNDYGQLIGFEYLHTAPECEETNDTVALTLSERFTCVLQMGSVFCFGGLPRFSRRFDPPTKVDRLVSGADFVCAVGSQIYCWNTTTDDDLIQYDATLACTTLNRLCVASGTEVRCYIENELVYQEQHGPDPIRLLECADTFYCVISNSSSFCSISVPTLATSADFSGVHQMRLSNNEVCLNEMCHAIDGPPSVECRLEGFNLVRCDHRLVQLPCQANNWSISNSALHACVTTAGPNSTYLYCWGDNTYGQSQHELNASFVPPERMALTFFRKGGLSTKRFNNNWYILIGLVAGGLILLLGIAIYLRSSPTINVGRKSESKNELRRGHKARRGR